MPLHAWGMTCKREHVSLVLPLSYALASMPALAPKSWLGHVGRHDACWYRSLPVSERGSGSVLLALDVLAV